MLALFKSDQWHFHQDNAPVYNSILVIDYLTKMGIKTVPQPPCDFWLIPKLRGCPYERIEEMKEAVTKVIDTLTQEDFHGAFQKLLEQYNKCIAVRGDYFKGDKSFMCVLSIKVPIRKKSGNLFNDARIYIILLNTLSGGQSYFVVPGMAVLPQATKTVLSPLVGGWWGQGIAHAFTHCMMNIAILSDPSDSNFNVEIIK